MCVCTFDGFGALLRGSTVSVIDVTSPGQDPINKVPTLITLRFFEHSDWFSQLFSANQSA